MVYKNIDHLVKTTLKNLSLKSLDATPANYKSEFCKVAKKYDLQLHECEQFKNLVAKLSKNQQIDIETKNIFNVEGLIDYLLSKVAIKNLDNLAELINSSITPSISLELDENLARFSIKIGNSPSLIFEEDIQKEIENFINKRFESDKNIVAQKTSDIAKLITLMGRYLNDAIHSSDNSGETVRVIKTELTNIDLSDSSRHGLFALQNKLIVAAGDIESEMSKVSEKLKSNHSKVKVLEHKVEQLQEELSLAKQESQIDHLTGTLTRRAFGASSAIFENNFLRNSIDFAVVFFDIDHFKTINDTYTHDGGDVVLSTFAKILLKETRQTDIVARYGGEEFICIVSYTDILAIEAYLTRIKQIVHQSRFVYKDSKIKISFSAGVAFRSSHINLEDTIQQADVLLYKAKNSGRDLIIIENGHQL